MPEERTVSAFTWITPPARSLMGLVQMTARTKVRQHYATETKVLLVRTLLNFIHMTHVAAQRLVKTRLPDQLSNSTTSRAKYFPRPHLWNLVYRMMTKMIPGLTKHQKNMVLPMYWMLRLLLPLTQPQDTLQRFWVTKRKPPYPT
jgi:hypothetical protein